MADVSGTAPFTPLRIDAVVATDSDVRTNSTTFGAFLQDFNVSPDGTQLYYIASSNGFNNDQLYLVDVTAADPASTVVQVSQAQPSTSSDVDYAQWTPDGQRIIYMADPITAFIDELWIVDVSGATPGVPQKLSGTMVSSGDIQFSTTPGASFSVSPDGNWVAYRADELFDEQDDVYVVNISGPGPYISTRVSQDPMDRNLDTFSFLWAPSSRKLAYRGDLLASAINEMFVVELNALDEWSAPILVSHSGRPAGADVSTTSHEWAWSVDGSRLFFEFDGVVDNNFEAWVLTINNGVAEPPIALNPPLPANGDVSTFIVQQ